MKVFISHDFNDTKLARRVAGTLREAGFQVWDYSEINPVDNWRESLGKALDESNAMVVLLTPNSVHSYNVSHDLNYALGKLEYKGRVISVIANPSQQLSPREIPWVLNLELFQKISLPNLENDEEGLKKIAQALKAVA